MDRHIEKELDRVYLIPELDRIDENEYIFQMALRGKLSSTLPLSLTKRDGTVCLRADVTACTSISSRYTSVPFTGADLRKLLMTIRDVCSKMPKLLMSVQDLYLDPECMFLGPGTDEVLLCYLPHISDTEPHSIRLFSEFVLKHLDHSDLAAVNLAYSLYDLVSSDTYILPEVIQKLLKNTVTNAGARGPSGSPPGTDPQQPKIIPGQFGPNLRQHNISPGQFGPNPRQQNISPGQFSPNPQQHNISPGQGRNRQVNNYIYSPNPADDHSSSYNYSSDRSPNRHSEGPRNSNRQRSNSRNPNRHSSNPRNPKRHSSNPRNPNRHSSNSRNPKRHSSNLNNPNRRNSGSHGPGRSRKSIRKLLIPAGIILLSAILIAVIFHFDLTQIGGLGFLCAALIWMTNNALEKSRSDLNNLWMDDSDVDEDDEQFYQSLREELYSSGNSNIYDRQNAPFQSGSSGQQSFANFSGFPGQQSPSDQFGVSGQQSFANHSGFPNQQSPSDQPGFSGQQSFANQSKSSESQDRSAADAFRRTPDTGTLQSDPLRTGKPPVLVSLDHSLCGDICLNCDHLILGKSRSEADLILEDDTVSRRHVRIEKRTDGYYVTDLFSTNGTFLDDSRLEGGRAVLLKDGARLTISRLHFHVVIPT